MILTAPRRETTTIKANNDEVIDHLMGAMHHNPLMERMYDVLKKRDGYPSYSVVRDFVDCITDHGHDVYRLEVIKLLEDVDSLDEADKDFLSNIDEMTFTAIGRYAQRVCDVYQVATVSFKKTRVPTFLLCFGWRVANYLYQRDVYGEYTIQLGMVLVNVISCLNSDEHYIGNYGDDHVYTWDDRSDIYCSEDTITFGCYSDVMKSNRTKYDYVMLQLFDLSRGFIFDPFDTLSAEVFPRNPLPYVKYSNALTNRSGVASGCCYPIFGRCVEMIASRFPHVFYASSDGLCVLDARTGTVASIVGSWLKSFCRRMYGDYGVYPRGDLIKIVIQCCPNDGHDAYMQAQRNVLMHSINGNIDSIGEGVVDEYLLRKKDGAAKRVEEVISKKLLKHQASLNKEHKRRTEQSKKDKAVAALASKMKIQGVTALEFADALSVLVCEVTRLWACNTRSQRILSLIGFVNTIRVIYKSLSRGSGIMFDMYIALEDMTSVVDKISSLGWNAVTEATWAVAPQDNPWDKFHAEIQGLEKCEWEGALGDFAADFSDTAKVDLDQFAKLFPAEEWSGRIFFQASLLGIHPIKETKADLTTEVKWVRSDIQAQGGFTRVFSRFSDTRLGAVVNYFTSFAFVSFLCSYIRPGVKFQEVMDWIWKMKTNLTVTTGFLGVVEKIRDLVSEIYAWYCGDSNAGNLFEILFRTDGAKQIIDDVVFYHKQAKDPTVVALEKHYPKWRENVQKVHPAKLWLNVGEKLCSRLYDVIKDAENAKISDVNTLTKAIEDVKGAMSQGASVLYKHYGRVAPFVITLSGPPGTGKSYIVDALAAYFLAQRHAQDPYAVGEFLYNKGMVYGRNPTDDYWSAYCGQPVLLVDDMGANYPGTDISDAKALMEIIQAVNNAPYHINQAALGDKGMLFRSELVIITTNNPEAFASKLMTSPGRFYRRLGLLAEVKLKPEFVVQNDVVAFNHKDAGRLTPAVRLNHDEVSKLTPILGMPGFYNINAIKACYVANTDVFAREPYVPSVTDTLSFITFACEEIRKYYLRSNNMGNQAIVDMPITLCPHARHPGSCNQCEPVTVSLRKDVEIAPLRHEEELPADEIITHRQAVNNDVSALPPGTLITYPEGHDLENDPLQVQSVLTAILASTMTTTGLTFVGWIVAATVAKDITHAIVDEGVEVIFDRAPARVSLNLSKRWQDAKLSFLSYALTFRVVRWGISAYAAGIDMQTVAIERVTSAFTYLRTQFEIMYLRYRTMILASVATLSTAVGGYYLMRYMQKDDQITKQGLRLAQPGTLLKLDSLNVNTQTFEPLPMPNTGRAIATPTYDTNGINSVKAKLLNAVVRIDVRQGNYVGQVHGFIVAGQAVVMPAHAISKDIPGNVELNIVSQEFSGTKVYDLGAFTFSPRTDLVMFNVGKAGKDMTKCLVQGNHTWNDVTAFMVKFDENWMSSTPNCKAPLPEFVELKDFCSHSVRASTFQHDGSIATVPGYTYRVPGLYVGVCGAPIVVIHKYGDASEHFMVVGHHVAALATDKTRGFAVAYTNTHMNEMGLRDVRKYGLRRPDIDGHFGSTDVLQVTPPDGRTLFDHFESGVNGSVQGLLREYGRSPDKSNISLSPYAKLFPDITAKYTVPNVKSKLVTESDGTITWLAPLPAIISQVGAGTFSAHGPILREAARQFVSHFAGIVGHDRLGALKPYPVQKVWQRANMNSAVGMPHPGKVVDYTETLGHADAFSAVVPDERILDGVNFVKQRHEGGMSANILTRMTIKDEPISREKDNMKLHRGFEPGNRELYVLVAQLFAPIFDLSKEFRCDVDSAIGINVFDADEVERLYNKLKDRLCLDTDYKKYDKLLVLCGEILRYWLDWLTPFLTNYTKAQVDEMYACVDELCNHMVLMGVVIIMFYGLWPSGTWGTAEFNCVMESILHISAFLISFVSHGGIEGEWPDFYAYFTLVNYGDDNVDAEVIPCPWFQPCHRKAAFAMLGMHVTSTDKKSELVHKDVTEVSFLKRKFKKHDDLGHMVMVLDLESIGKMLTFIEKSGSLNPTEVLRATVVAAEIELAQWGRSVYNEYRDKINSLESEARARMAEYDDIIGRLKRREIKASWC